MGTGSGAEPGRWVGGLWSETEWWTDGGSSSRGGTEVNEAGVKTAQLTSPACGSARVLHTLDPAADDPSTQKRDWCTRVCACVWERGGDGEGGSKEKKKRRGWRKRAQRVRQSRWRRRRRREVADDCSKGIPRLEKGFAPSLYPPTLRLLLTRNPDVLVFICAVLHLHWHIFASIFHQLRRKRDDSIRK